MPSEDDTFAEILQNARKLCQNLQSPDKRTRKQTYIDFQQLFEHHEFTEAQLRQIYTESHVYFLQGLRDKTELVREQTIKFLTYLIVDRLPLNDFYLTYPFPVFVERIGTVELVEESEEIRLELLKLIHAIILKYTLTEQLKPFIGDCVLILSECVTDKHPAIKELACKVIVDLASALPGDFHLQSGNLVKPILTCFSHQRYRVRVEAVNAIGVVVMHSSYEALNESVGPLAERLFDQIPIVRQTVARVAAGWLMEYRDRYSFFYKLLPLLLTGLNDEVEETRKESYFWWNKVGLQYQQENEKDLKDQLDFLLEPPKYYPEHLERPILGCRVLVQRNVSKLCKALANELNSWQNDVRVRCSQLLVCLALHAEDDITQNLQDLLPAMYSTARDDDKRVANNIIRACEIMGVFVPAKTWLKLMLPVINDSSHWGHLAVLNGFIHGTPAEYLTDHLKEISGTLSDDSICHTRKKNNQIELIKSVEIIATKITEASRSEIAYDLFKITVVCMSLRHPDNVHIDAKQLQQLSKSLAFDESDQIWSVHVPKLLEEIAKSEPKCWLLTTCQRCVFETILLHCGRAFGENLQVIGGILSETLEPGCDAEARLKTFWALSEALEEKKTIFERSDGDGITRFLETLITDVFVPGLIWHAGLTAEALRTMTASCLLNALTSHEDVQLFNDSEVFKALFDQLSPLLLSLLEDASYVSRQLAAECLVVLKCHAVDKQVWTCDDLLKIYPDLLKRLDDPTEKVRLNVLQLLPKFFKNAPEEFSRDHYKAHHEFIVDTLMTHFDDSEETMRNLVFDVLKTVALINKEELVRKVERHKSVLINQSGCDRIIEYCTNLS